MSRDKKWRIEQKRRKDRAIDEWEHEEQETFWDEWERAQKNQSRHNDEEWYMDEIGTMTAWEEIHERLEVGEQFEPIVFGPWAWGMSEDVPKPEVPPSVMGRRLLPQEAKPFLEAFSFSGSYGSPECYATWVYTNKRVMWVTQYDGSTCLDAMPRNPTNGEMPYMPGG